MNNDSRQSNESKWTVRKNLSAKVNGPKILKSEIRRPRSVKLNGPKNNKRMVKKLKAVDLELSKWMSSVDNQN